MDADNENGNDGEWGWLILMVLDGGDDGGGDGGGGGSSGSGDGDGGADDVDESSSWWLSLPRAATQETPGHCPKHLSTVVILIIIMFW